MSSRKFTISEATKKDVCVRGLLALIMVGIVAIAIMVGIYAFKHSEIELGGCKQPILDPYGLSNWTKGAEVIALGCFPGHSIEGHHQNDVIISTCIDKVWVPPPPSCAAFPISLLCQVNQDGLIGNIRMWQNSNSTPTFVDGFLNTTGVNKNKPVLLSTIELSRSKCLANPDDNDTLLPDPSEFLDNQIEVRFNSTRILAYKKAELKISMIFIDIPSNLTATVVSLHQGNETLVMKTPIISTSVDVEDDNSPKETETPQQVLKENHPKKLDYDHENIKTEIQSKGQDSKMEETKNEDVV